MSFPPRKRCCDPLKCHQKVQKRDLRPVSQTVIHLLPSLGLTKRQYLCSSCRIKLKPQVDEAALPPVEAMDYTVTSLDDASCSENKESEDEDCTSSEETSDISVEDTDEPSSSAKVRRTDEKESEDVVLLASDAEEMVKQLKEKFQQAKTRSDRMKVLTVLPKRWSIPMQCNPPSIGCYFGSCNQCPGVGSLSSSLQAVMDENAIDTVELRQWTTTDRASLETRVLEVDEFIDTFTSMLKKLLLHDFIAKMQTMFMHEKRESLREGEFFVITDFSENYSFVVQDEIQAFHWNNGSATIHPFVCHYIKEDFGVFAEWHFFATSHGKSEGDGAGGTLKRITARRSLQKPYQDQILTTRQLYEFAVSQIKGMHFGFATVAEHDQEAKLLQEQLKTSRTVPGTQKIHSVVPVATNLIEVRPFSYSTSSRKEKVALTHLPNSFSACAPGGYVTVAYEGSCWLGCVLSVDESERAVTVTFLHPCIPARSYVYPEQEDIMVVDPSDILTTANPTTVTGRTYTLTKKEMEEASSALATMDT
ncbi:hypothetical protein EMCRGX_G016283 [Ephydatia muelleri]